MVLSFLKKYFLGLALLLLCSIIKGAFAEEIILWHSFDGPLEEKFIAIVERFNQRPELIQAGIKISSQYIGNYEKTLAAGLKVLNTPNAPHILQVYEMGNLVMQAHPNATVPLDKLSDKSSSFLDSEHFVPLIRAFYKAQDGTKGLPSLPFSASSMVLFYNKNAFRAAGLDPERGPVTWEEFEEMANILKEKGVKYVMASGWLSGHHIEQTGAWHNQAVATKGNGIDGSGPELILNNPFFTHHLNKLASWYKKDIFSLDYWSTAEQAFANEEVVILTQGANRLPMLEKLVGNKFEIGVSTFPYWKSQISEPQNTIAGGASFWVLAGHDPKVYPHIQVFFEYLVSPDVQAEWHQATCYMPVIVGAEAISEKQKFYEQGLKGRAAKIALDSYTGNPPKEYSRGVLLPNFPKVREVIVQEMKEAIRGNKSAKDALDNMVVVGNQMMLGDNQP